MPHEYAKHHLTGEGVKLISTPTELIELMIPGPNERQAAIHEIDNEGPSHRQVFSALLLNRLNKMIHAVEKANNVKFKLQEGFELVKDDHGKDEVLFVELPVSLGSDLLKKQIADAISHAPEHEALVYAMCLQAVEWTILSIEHKD